MWLVARSFTIVLCCILFVEVSGLAIRNRFLKTLTRVDNIDEGFRFLLDTPSGGNFGYADKDKKSSDSRTNSISKSIEDSFDNIVEPTSRSSTLPDGLRFMQFTDTVKNNNVGSSKKTRGGGSDVVRQFDAVVLSKRSIDSSKRIPKNFGMLLAKFERSVSQDGKKTETHYVVLGTNKKHYIKEEDLVKGNIFGMWG